MLRSSYINFKSIYEDLSMKLPKNCDQCLNEYLVRSDKFHTSRFCSKQCQMKNMANQSVTNLRERWAQENKVDALIKSLERFVIKKDGCWEWIGCTKKRPKYGSLTFRGKEIIAHRASYMAYKGEIPKGILVLHTCDNPPCTNPEHLWLGTHLDNERDKMAKGRHKGEKLNPDKVKEIKRLLSQGVLHKQICKDFNISTTTVHSIQTGKTWKDIQ
jgi:hypothetical protein